MSYWVGGSMVAGSLIKGFGDNKAAGQEAKGYDKARDELRNMEGDANRAVDITDPFNSYRNTYASQLNDILSGNRRIEEDPGYQYAYDTSMQAVSRGAAAGGYNNSGNVQMALQKNASGLASQQYNTIIERLMNISGAGSQNAMQAGNQYGNMMTEMRMGVGNSYIGQASARGAGTSSLFSGIGGGVSALGGMGGGGGGTIGGQLDNLVGESKLF